MASRKDNLKGLMQNSRTRVIIIITAVILIFSMIYGYLRFTSSGNSVGSVTSKMKSAPNIKSIPGALDQTAEYSSLQNKQNIEQAEKALQSGGSAIPTIINVQKFGDGVTEVGPKGGTGGLGFSSLSKLGEGQIKPFWVEDLEKNNCDKKSLKAAVQNGAQISDLKDYCSCQQLKEYGFKLAELNSVCECGELRLLGYSALEMKNIGLNAGKLRECGYSACEEKAAGFTAMEMKNGGFPDAELKGAGFSRGDLAQASGLPVGISSDDVLKKGCNVESLKELKAKGVSASAIRHISGCSIDQLKKAGFTAAELKDAGFTAADLKNAGFSPEDLKNAGFSAKDLMEAGFTPDELAAAGYSANDIKRAQNELPKTLSAAEIRQNACDIEALKAEKLAGVSAANINKVVKCSPEALLKAGFSPEELAQAGILSEDAAANVSNDDIRKAGCDPQKLAELRQQGVSAQRIMQISKCSPETLKAAGFSAADLLKAGLTPEQLAKAGFSPDEIQKAQDMLASELADAIKTAGCDPEKLAALQKQGVSAAAIIKANGCSPDVLRKAGFSAKDLLKAGFTPEQLAAAGYSPQEIADAKKAVIDALVNGKKQGCTPEVAAKAKAEGMSAADLRKNLGCSLAALKAAGFTAKELKDAGFTPGELAKAGYSLPELLAAGFTPADLKAAGFTAKELKDAGVSPKDLLDAGFTPEELLKAGISPKDLLAAGVSVADLKKAGVSAKELLAAGISPSALKAAGFSADELQKAGVNDATLAGLGLDPKLGALANVADVNLEKSNAPSISSMLQGGNQASNVQKNAEQLDKIMSEQKKMQAQQKFQQKIQNRVAGMQAYAQQLLAGWKVTGTQAYVAGTVKTAKESDLAAMGTKGQVKPDKTGAIPESMVEDKAPTIKTGDILFAVVDTAVNSDEPGPLLATIVNGPLKGAKLIGSFASGSASADKLTVNFNTMSVPWLTKTVGISAYAIDPDTGRTALSSSTNHHYVERYGALFASTFLEGFGNAFQSADTTITIGGTGGETNTTVENGIDRSLTDNAIIALATVGKAWGQQAQKNMNKPTTIQIYSGTPVGVLFLQDVMIAEK